MIINDLDDYYIVFDTKNRNTELDTLISYTQCAFSYIYDRRTKDSLIAEVYIVIRSIGFHIGI